ncbi:reverse transcriptase family protein [Zhouia spongiae]|uniref:RNA-directed DNA polymerase n=1 Tax=Zhouia spongiae TaxID=2202721 RepID=A0ABY3YMB0_9FLAO|nr:reverse transcriptase family protein [Zhouia spongiae]UNY98786.1 reverse transcriptase family protein [Zhouia spongiae]
MEKHKLVTLVTASFYMKVSDINNLNLLANYLKLDKNLLKTICENDYIGLSAREILKYRADNSDLTLVIKKIKIYKKNGGIRTVYSPVSDSVINCLKVLNKKLSKIYVPSKNVFGFIKGRSVQSNASQHLGKKYVYKVDLKDYFECINSDMLEKAFMRLGFNKAVLDCLCKIVTINNTLAQGFHTSPTLANIVFIDLDNVFSNISKNITYTRYADDLYFSSDEEFEIHDFIVENLKKFGFEVNESKTRMMKRGSKQYVTGLTVFDPDYPRIAKRIKKKIRQEIYYIKKYGYKGHVMHKLKVKNKDYKTNEDVKNKVDLAISELQSKINGWLLYINSIEPKFSKKYSEFLYKKSFKPISNN